MTLSNFSGDNIRIILHLFVLLSSITLFLAMLIRKRKICNNMSLSKFEKWIAIWMAVLTTITTIMVVYPIVTEKTSNITAYETVQRINNTNRQGYRIILNNIGNIYAKNVEIEITLPFETCKITKIFHSDEDIIGEQSWGVGDYRYKINYPKIRENKEVVLTIIFENEDFDINGTEVITNFEKNIWTDTQSDINLVYYEDIFIH